MSRLSEVYKETPIHLKNIIPLDFDTVKSVPESHEWPQHDGHGPVNDKKMSIPVIDVTDPNVVELVRQASETWGMFQVIKHGVDLRLFEEVEAEARRLFSLPTAHKLKVLRSPEIPTGYGMARISSNCDKNLWHEGFTIIGSCLDNVKQLWPHDYNRFW